MNINFDILTRALEVCSLASSVNSTTLSPGVSRRFFEDSGTDTQVIVIDEVDDVLEIAFRSTEIDKWADIKTDLTIKKERTDDGNRVHGGFWSCMCSLYYPISELVSKAKRDRKKVRIYGHSLGGALGHCLSHKLYHNGLRVDSLYAFGNPRAFSRNTAREVEREYGNRIWNIWNHRDPVPEMPKLNYLHAGNVAYINRSGGILFNPTVREMSKDKSKGFWSDLFNPRIELRFMKYHGLSIYKKMINGTI